MHFFWVLIVKLLSLQYFSDGIEQLLANNKSCECRFDNELVVCENCDSVSVRREIIKVGGREMTIDIKIINTTFPRNTIPSYWFPEKIRITDTMIIDNFTSDIEPNAFHTIAFRKAMTLHFNMPLEILRNGSLNGLPKLRKLVLQSTKIRIIEMEMPGTIALKNVAVCELDFDAEQIVRLLDLFKANLVQSIRINKNNLLRKVTRDLFSKFSNLTTLALYENKIAEIESQSFDAFGETLMYINLRQNLLKTLPDRVFPEAFLADQASIVKLVALQDNPWDCNCDLNYLKTVQIAYRKRFLIKPLCYTPLSLRDKRVVEVDLCNEGVEVTVCCRSGDDSIAKIKLLENRLMRAVVSPKGELEIHVKSISSIHAMIWLENEPPETETFSIAQCVITRNTSAFTSIKKLESGKIYKFCLIEKLANKLRPINCMLYRNIQSNAPDVGLDDDMRLCVAVAAVCVCILAAFAGAGLTIISSKYFYKRNAVDFGGNRNFSERNCKDFWPNVEIPPPLPPHPRPRSMHSSSISSEDTTSHEYFDLDNYYVCLQ